MQIIILLIFSVIFFSQPCAARELYNAETAPPVVTTTPSLYDVLSNLEKQVYGRNYDCEDISKRVDRLENSVFGVKSRGSFVSRVDKLKNSLAVMKSRQLNTRQQVFIEMLENRYFGIIYKQDKIEDRLTRLEKTILGKPYIGTSDYRFDNLVKKVPITIVGISVSDNSGNKASIKPEIKRVERYDALSDLKYNEAEGDYFDNIRKYDENKVLRWKDLPVYIYIAKNIDANKVKTAQKAAQVWGQYIQLTAVNNSRDAKIIINWDNNRNNSIEPVLIPNNDEMMSKVIIQAGDYEDLEYLDRLLLHELGHALGIWGHSNDSSDIMYDFQELNFNYIYYGLNNKNTPIKNAPDKPSKRDINTLIKIYNSPAQ